MLDFLNTEAAIGGSSSFYNRPDESAADDMQNFVYSFFVLSYCDEKYCYPFVEQEDYLDPCPEDLDSDQYMVERKPKSEIDLYIDQGHKTQDILIAANLESGFDLELRWLSDWDTPDHHRLFILPDLDHMPFSSRALMLFYLESPLEFRVTQETYSAWENSEMAVEWNKILRETTPGVNPVIKYHQPESEPIYLEFGKDGFYRQAFTTKGRRPSTRVRGGRLTPKLGPTIAEAIQNLT